MSQMFESAMVLRALKFGYANARVKSMKQNLLGQKELGAMLEARSVQEIYSILEKTPYREDLVANSLNEKTIADKIELACSHNFSRTLAKILKMSPRDSQEKIAAMFEKYDIKNEKAFLYWLRVLVQNTIYDLHDYHSADKRDLHLEAKHNASTDSVAKSLIGNLPAGSVWNPASQLRKKEESLELEAAMDSLSDEDKEVIIMHQYSELSFPEISELTGVAADTLRMRFGRAMDKLTDAMTEKSTK